MGYNNDEVSTQQLVATAIRDEQRNERRKRKMNYSFDDGQSLNNTTSTSTSCFTPSPQQELDVEDPIVDFVVVNSTTTTTSMSNHVNVENVEEVQVTPPASSNTNNMSVSVGVQTDLSSRDIFSMEDSISQLTSQLSRMQITVCKVGVKEWFDTDGKVAFYTGLPTFDILETVFDFVTSGIVHSTRSSLSQFQEYSLTLMRFRLNFPIQDLSYRYNISTSTTSSIILKWTDLMCVKLNALIKWPIREDLIKTTPMSFRQHFKTSVVVIIDCFEIFINQPKNLMARAETFSSYKHHNTIKILIGITPQGIISFVSKAWGGRVSDKHLTDNCGLLKNLLPQDVVLADRGFDIGESTALYGATVEIPAFTKGKKQLSAFDVEHSRKLASVRIHVERVIGLLRNKYTILQDILPLDYLMRVDEDNMSTIDKIIFVCSALTNICDSVIPVD